MLSAATLTVADRLIATLMTLVDAVGTVAHTGAHTGASKTLPCHAAENLFIRLVGLVTTLIRYCNFGIRPRSEREPAENPREPVPLDERRDHVRAERLPTRPGWLLAALPDLAPAIAADLRLLLADPAVADLLAAAPTLDRALRPLLRGLGLTQPSPGPDPAPTPRSPPPPSPPAPDLASPPATQADLPFRPLGRPASHTQSIP